MAEPGRLLSCNRVMDGTAMRRLISSLVTRFGTVYTAHVPDQLKTLGFQQATSASLSLGIDDLSATPSREWLIRDAESLALFENNRCGNVHAVERLRQLIEAWYAISEYVKAGVHLNFGITDNINPVYVMSFSGARGSISQIHQSLGMRGLMLDPEGQIIELPVRGNFREGLSLTEYIISCYGARKGIVDIAVRTADAGYLTRRLVEVVQRIVVRRIDCGSTRGITVSYNPRNKQNGRIIVAQLRLIGRVLASNVYAGTRCIATRNQDIGVGLANQLIALRARPLYIRSPLGCDSIMFWICRLCYGWSLARQGLVGLGEAVGIIAGQSIGEPGTQLTLRTFHTGGVFTGDVAQHVRAPFTGITRYNATLVRLTRTRHGHPAWVCDDDLSVTICNKYEMRHLIIPPQSLVLVKDHQYVKSKQVIAEVVHTATPATVGVVHKCINSDTCGELHVGARVSRGLEHGYNNIIALPEASHIWVLSAGKLRSGGTRPIFYGVRDRLGTHQTLLAGEDPFHPIVHTVIPKSIRPLHDDRPVEDPGHSLTECYNHRRGLIHLSPARSNSLVPRGVPPLCRLPGRNTRSVKLPYSAAKGVLRRDKGYSPFVKNSIVSNYSDGGDTAEELRRTIRPLVVSGGAPGNKVEGLLVMSCETVVGEYRPSLIYEDHANVCNLTLSASAAALPASTNVGSISPPARRIGGRRGGGSAGQRATRDGSSNVKAAGVVKRAGVVLCGSKAPFMLPIEIVTGDSGSVDWKYYSCVFRNVGYSPIKFNPMRGKWWDLAPLAFPDNRADPPGELTDPNRAAHATPIEMVNPPLPFAQYYVNYRGNLGARSEGSEDCGVMAGLQYFSNVRANRRDRCSSDRRPVLGCKVGILRGSPDEYRKGASSFVLSPADISNIPLPPHRVGGNGRRPGGNNAASLIPVDPLGSPFTSGSARRAGRSAQLDTGTGVSSTGALLAAPPYDLARMAPVGPLGVSAGHPNAYSPAHTTRPSTFNYCRASINGTLPPNKDYIMENPSEAPPEVRWYLWGEDITAGPPYSVGTRGKKRSTYLYSRGHIPRSSAYLPCAKPRYRAVTLGQFICVGGAPTHQGSAPSRRSYQVKAIGAESMFIRFAEPYLADGGATVHVGPGDIVSKGDTLMTLIYERLRFGDIIFQGLPKIEQFLESRPGTSVSADLRDSFLDWSNSMAWIFGCPLGYLLSSRMSLERSKITLVDRIGGGYRSQGVRIADKHMEIVACRIAAKLGNLEDGMANVFPPGEPIETSRARRMNRATGAGSTYRPVLLGATGASPSTDGFLSEASLRDTARVSAGAAIRGQTDWLRGLKENVIVGGTVPTGTGRGGVLRPLNLPGEPRGIGASGVIQYLSTTMGEYPCLARCPLGPEFLLLPSGIAAHRALASLLGDDSSQ
uniref:DNA-directed RNA polymerase n=1 Tax=Selaginella kraussiana TaxID=81964 RepID=A0A3Q9R254_9TRAC|nr:RNA polymerase subunit beta'' [Selaginella kraussiana]AZU95837.1 RNA polymerase subunit beta'' [Selaginella kraussiana]